MTNTFILCMKYSTWLSWKGDKSMVRYGLYRKYQNNFFKLLMFYFSLDLTYNFLFHPKSNYSTNWINFSVNLPEPGRSIVNSVLSQSKNPSKCNKIHHISSRFLLCNNIIWKQTSSHKGAKYTTTFEDIKEGWLCYINSLKIPNTGLENL